ncbi:META domain-containing protein [Shewanella litorisediminis]|uniref:META domain-containing protein n=1 Tax=Shewanella litorisediminis TaxID=1173586 RepID=A0ABX7G1G1_9GAMM|nr:META domain-containing protein [Shewanella litorisediminis]MCL2918960.1 META domain-containing protein [Shewanella litorisediminis]QRH01028.1 META domain-containing protein [Shewanella litorisediminis]
MIKKFALLAGALALVGCQSSPSSHADTVNLLGTWLIEQVNDHPVIDYSPAKLVFEEGNKLHGNNSCNNFFGSFELQGNQLLLSPSGTTRKACVDALMDQEARVADALPKVRSLAQGEGKLRLFDSEGKLLLILSRL